MKQCFVCKKVKQTRFFVKDRAKKDGFSSYCKICTRDRDKHYYRLNQKSRYSQYTERKNRITKENRQKVWDYLFDNPCVDCGEKDIIVLQFDHLTDKKGSISKMIASGIGWNRIYIEINKCQVVCANCHTRRTAKSQKWSKFVNKQAKIAKVVKAPD